MQRICRSRALLTHTPAEPGGKKLLFTAARGFELAKVSVPHNDAEEERRKKTGMKDAGGQIKQLEVRESL